MQEAKALITVNSSATGPAPYQGILVDHRKGQNPVKGRIF